MRGPDARLAAKAGIAWTNDEVRSARHLSDVRGAHRTSCRRALDWGGLGGGTRVLFAALLALGCYMIFRGARAGRRLAADTGTRSIAYIDDVGFTIIALLDAFLVIAVLDLGASGYVVTAVALLGAAIGHRTFETYKRSALSSAPASARGRTPP